MSKRIILASSSLQRKKLLSESGLDFTVDAPQYNETLNRGMSPHELAKALSIEKAREVAKRHKNSVVIAADTIVVVNNEILGKPHTAAKARAMLRKLSGKVHSVITGYTIIDTLHDNMVTQSVETKVRFKKLTEDDIAQYVKTREPLDKAGAYTVQGKGKVLVQKLNGSLSNVIGLPLEELKKSLSKFNVVY